MIWKKLNHDSVFIQKIDRELLERCKEHYEVIAICMKTPEIPFSMEYPFSSKNIIFAKPVDGKGSIDRHPAIWNILEEMEVSTGSGNGHSIQIRDHNFTRLTFKLIDSEWHYRLHAEVIENVSKDYGI
jgi:hypothetical protein